MLSTFWIIFFIFYSSRFFRWLCRATSRTLNTHTRAARTHTLCIHLFAVRYLLDCMSTWHTRSCSCWRRFLFFFIFLSTMNHIIFVNSSKRAFSLLIFSFLFFVRAQFVPFSHLLVAHSTVGSVWFSGFFFWIAFPADQMRNNKKAARFSHRAEAKGFSCTEFRAIEIN